MRLVKNRFYIGDLVCHNATGKTGIVIEVRLREPPERPPWWFHQEAQLVTIQYKVKFFHTNNKEQFYEDTRITLLSQPQ